MTDVSLPVTDSTDTLAADDLVPVFRPADKDDASENYGLSAQSISDLRPEYRNSQLTLEISSGALATAESSRTLSVASSRFAAPKLIWVVTHSQVTSGSTTWYLRGQWRGRNDANAATSSSRSWWYGRELGSANERVGNESSADLTDEFSLGSNRVPGSAAGGWGLTIVPSTRVLSLGQDGPAPNQSYTFVVQVAYAVIG